MFAQRPETYFHIQRDHVADLNLITSITPINLSTEGDTGARTAIRRGKESLIVVQETTL